ncbi:hypothetical protein EVAR_97380_1 [Eumeta japonica]|uniref:Uncharacterized protein n=1 Tax=Eumeta variegata TaxID=151549 RepID=A0A4C1YV59_EUMVA|nr:hypothetical protein EVAR_97380_1 [Eumeta japonica]
MTTLLLRLPAATTIPGPLSLMAGMLIVSCIAALAAAFVQRVARLRSQPPYCARRLVVSTQAYITTPAQVPEGAVLTWICCAELLDVVLLCTFAVVVGALLALYS